MEYQKLGNSELYVSKLCLGCMSFGDSGSRMHEWSLNPHDTEEMVAHALDIGLTFFDTSNNYSKGTSEEYLGRAIKRLTTRDKVILATKVYYNPGRLSKDAILREIDGSLKRLGTDYVDLYIIHRFDSSTPIPETMETLSSLVDAGKVRALGASSMYGYQFHNLQLYAEQNGLAKFVSMQNHYNLLYREDERELIPICNQLQVALTPYSPLASGRLSRPGWKADTFRSRTDKNSSEKYDATMEQDYPIVMRVHKLAQMYGVSMTQIALAWEFAKGATAPIIGATKTKYLDDAVGALQISLKPEEIDWLEELYIPHRVVGAL